MIDEGVVSNDIYKKAFPGDPTEIIGIPPSYVYDPDPTQKMALASIPIMAIYPAYPKYGTKGKKGIHLYEPNYADGKKQYNRILESAGVPLMAGNCIYATFLNNTSITESLSVEYGESKFEQIGNVASSTVSELAYITGSSGNIKEITNKISEQMGKSGTLGSIFGAGVDLMGSTGGALQKFIDNMAPGMGKIMAGHQIDFPMIWKGANFSPSYSMTIRLYNPNPKNMDDYRNFIVYPLAKLIALVIPISSSESTFYYPVVCSVSCPGLFKVKAGYISSMEIIKGGESNDIAFNQRPGMVDVRITIGELYNTLIAAGQDEEGNIIRSKDKHRPMYSDYINQMMSEAHVPDLNFTSFNAPGEPPDLLEFEGTPGFGDTEGSTDPSSRVPEDLSNIYNVL